MINTLSSRLPLGLLAILACISTGCSMDPPEDGVQIIVEQALDDAQQEVLETRLKSAMGDTPVSYSSTVINGMMTINLSPVDSPDDFAKQINVFAEGVRVEGNSIHFRPDLSKL